MVPTRRTRRVDTSSTLTKPFRSPLSTGRRPQQATGDAGKEADPSNVPLLSSPPTITAEPGVIHTDSPTQLPLASCSSPLSRPFRLSRPNSVHKLGSPTRQPLDSEYIALQKQHSSLSLQLKHLSTSLDTTSQAIKILGSDVDEDLERLIQKWRDASREAAEELFHVAKDRVDKMGGVGVWRERYQRESSNSTTPYGDTQWNDDSFDEDQLTNEQKEQLEIAREEAKREAEKYGLLEKPKNVVEHKEDDAFTIDMMLKQLNVDLDAIGYDLQAQRWS